jgi:hypothetical protein
MSNALMGVLAGFNHINQGIEQGRERKQRNTLAQLTGDYYAAPSQNGLAAIARAGGDPSQSANYGMKMEDREQAEIGQIAGLIASADPQRRAEIFAQAQPRLQAFAQKRGLPLPPAWNDALLPEIQQIAQVWGGAGQNNLPADIQTMEYYKKNPDQYQRQLELRRAAANQYGFQVVKGEDGVDRVIQTDKREGGAAVIGPNGQPTNYGNAETNAYVPAVMDSVGELPPDLSPEQIADEVFPHVVWQESRGNPNAVSPAGARGPAQLMPGTARAPGFGVTPQRDGSTRENLRTGRDYFLAMVKRYPGRLDLALAAYNAGPGAADKVRGPNPYQSRTPEDQAARTTNATEQAKVDTQVRNTDRVAESEATVAAAKARAEAEAKSAAERGADSIAKGKAFQVYQAAMDGLVRGLEGTTTNPAAGRMPAVTAGAQTAEGSIAAMAPVLKQLFRSTGEGVFTDKDQELLIAMLPTRTDHPEARKAKIANINAIVRAKLDAVGASAPSAPSGGNSVIRFDAQGNRIP